ATRRTLFRTDAGNDRSAGRAKNRESRCAIAEHVTRCFCQSWGLIVWSLRSIEASFVTQPSWLYRQDAYVTLLNESAVCQFISLAKPLRLLSPRRDGVVDLHRRY